jgi:aquaporin Z
MLIPKLVTELIGTFFLVLTIGCTVILGGTDKGIIPPLAIGSALMVMVFAGGHISGGHYNPAVAIGAGVMGLIHMPSIWIHIVAGLAGGVVAGLAFLFLNPGDK